MRLAPRADKCCPPTPVLLPLRLGGSSHPSRATGLAWAGSDKRQQIVALTDREVVVGVGRSDCGVLHRAATNMSRSHARLFLLDGKLHVADQGSTNGTFLRIRNPRALEVGDELIIGATVLRLEQH